MKSRSGRNQASKVDVVDVVDVVHEVLPNDTLLENVFDRNGNEVRLVVAEPGKDPYFEDEYRLNGICYRPRLDANIQSGRVSTPSAIVKSPDVTVLLDQTKDLIHKCVDLDKDFEVVVAHYVLASQVYDRFSRFGYMRLQGSYGTGKSRFLELMSKVCFRGVQLGVASSNAVLYRTLRLYPGTLCLDEADYDQLSVSSDLLKILNSGYQSSGSVWRCADGHRGYVPEAYPTFCPKVIASRRNYRDKSLESRILSQRSRMAQRIVPNSLSSSDLAKEIEDLRNALFSYRLHNWHVISDDVHVRGLEGLDMRTTEILKPLAIAAGANALPGEIIEYVKRLGRMRKPQRGERLRRITLQTISRYAEAGEEPLVSEVAEEVNKHLDPQERVSSRKMGSYLDELWIERCETNRGRRLILDREQVNAIVKEYTYSPMQSS